MALFGGMFGGGQKHPNLDRLTLAVQGSLGVQLTPPGDDVLPIIDSMTGRDLVSFENAHSAEGMQELFKAKLLRAMIDTQTRSLVLSIATREELDSELKTAHGAVKVMHTAAHHGTSRIIKSFGPAEGIKAVVPESTVMAARPESVQAESTAVPPAFEHLEAAERLCATIVDLFVKHGQLTTADKEVLKKIKPVDYTLEARMGALERWRAELTRRARGVHVQQSGATSLLASANEAAQQSEEAILRRFDNFVHWLGKLLKALEHKGIKFHGKPVWLPH